MFIPTRYFGTFQEARAKREELQGAGFDQARIVEFERGHAVQYRRSGGYYPNSPTRFDRTGEWDLESILTSKPKKELDHA